MSDNTFQGVAVVTGGASGMGRATALRLAKAGASLVLADLNEEGLAETVGLLDGAAGEVRTVAGNLADEDVVKEIFTVAQGLGPVTGVANIAGVNVRKSLANTTLEDWRFALDVNLTSTFLVCREAAPVLEEGGAIVNVSSLSGIRGIGYPSYCAAKGGVVALTTMLATELAPRIRVNGIAPGPTQTPFVGALNEVAEQGFAQTSLLKRWATPDEMASVIEFLLGPASSYVTGQIIAVDGGISTTVNLVGQDAYMGLGKK
ncbi:SDR family NAD(P)-dependent oxidoreductase [Microbacterium sp. No. 7]|uniref:SDR family NAD(P)-dependent oxidoreductase n=1 Tax=Microbacterium sp. No. 7 TaxID=1714373 RepID=UPI0006D17907|nr:SDR family NAD(P)-dependent oxidoreductase [Microbacterium sp. No. 7]ALJ19277.1 hypothetical protein AOA12_04905 [Microbacterium sp. No. 7]